jgi:hypothetical protein
MASDDELGPFNAEEAADIIRKMGLGEDDELILVGGQAVAFRTRRLAENDPRLDEYLLTSKDVDFLGRLSDVREIADRLGERSAHSVATCNSVSGIAV